MRITTQVAQPDLDHFAVIPNIGGLSILVRAPHIGRLIWMHYGQENEEIKFPPMMSQYVGESGVSVEITCTHLPVALRNLSEGDA